MNIFEKASRENLLFPSARGNLTLSQVWALPLASKGDVSIDAIAVSVNAELQKSSEKSFVSNKSTPEDSKNKLRLDILLHIIDVLKAEQDAKIKSAETQTKLEKLRGALKAKEDQALLESSPEELQKLIKELEANS